MLTYGNNKGGQLFRAILHILNRKDKLFSFVFKIFKWEIMENKLKIDKETMTRLPIGAILPVPCMTAAELDNAYYNAYHIRKKYPREDGGIYKISRSVKTMTVTVSVEKGET